MADPVYTLVEARNMLALYIDAEKVVLTGQSYTIKDRTLSRANLKEIRAGRSEWAAKVQRLEHGGGIRTRRVIPRDE
jgi:hypothetical protein